ncbi:transposase, partial [Cupriavidus sp. AcVe19-6a]|uniref:transposase n=1 Tax=Cupriavidus sp. AcVe19-6a TaxID=2821358 RepID=UPI001FD74C75
AQRCWFHKMGNVLNALPKSQHGRAKADLQAIWMAATRADANAAFDRFVTIYGAKYPKATGVLTKDRGSLLTFYDFPAEHWQHIRTTDEVDKRPVCFRSFMVSVSVATERVPHLPAVAL